MLQTRTPADFSAALQNFADTARGANSFVITSHVNGDGDSVGSSLALYRLLRALGKTARVVHPAPIPRIFRFLDADGVVEPYGAALHDEALASADALCVLDANAPVRMKGMETAIAASRARKLVLDHHQDPQPFADVYAVDSDACSTAELVFRLMLVMGEQYCSKTFAEAVYVGIMTDTGSFRFPRTTAETHRIIARLIEAGADPVELHERVYNQSSLSRSRLLGSALAGLRTFFEGGLCLMTISRAALDASGATLEDIEGFVEHTLAVEGARMGVLAVELPDEIKISVRSKGLLPANAIAAHFGGGGHTNAAGCRARGARLEETERLLLRLAAPYFQGDLP